ncbi:MAG TPA: hypothetical protein VN580_07215 [Clostridia bacterium]|nr:hypothetical protein [Clostridia bacterium]
MKLHIVYLSVCIITLVLNLCLSRHMMSRYISGRSRKASGCDEVITFSLKGRSGIGEGTTETVPCDDTAALR